MKKLLLYSLALVGMLVTSTQSAVAQSTVNILTFDKKGPVYTTGAGYFTVDYGTDNNGTAKTYARVDCYEIPIIDGVEYAKGWKIQSGCTCSFTTANKALLKIVFVDKNSNKSYYYGINVDGTEKSISAAGTLYVELEKGAHKLTRKDECGIAYIGVFENYSSISNKISTMYYEYPVSLADGLTAYTGKVNGNSVSLTAIEGNVVKANTPVIVKATTDGTYYINESNVVGAGDASDLSGTATAITVDPNTHYTLGHKDGDPSAEIGFYRFTGAEIPANKAYIDGATVSGGAPKFLSIEGDGNTTGIHDTMIDNADVDAPMFNIAGQRVGNNAKGLVIKNGKKYMLK